MAQSQHSLSLLDTGSLGSVKQARIAIVYTEWNDKIVSEQIKGCERIAEAHGAIITEKLAVPGSFEIPFACKQLYLSYEEDEENAPEAIIAFGAVIRGGTPHFEYVCKAVTEGILELNLMLSIPTIFGVLTLDTEEQAWERLGGAHGHKGEEAAITALKMIKNSRAKGF
ncbi:MAG: 6,7-dimethyl-8-ribityllumazine synthase [Sphingobacteriales bacterium]|nr:MAG: 6,7-dimethyl-8-ribityllumazine synthase [Sphingobacteriales bacterium]